MKKVASQFGINFSLPKLQISKAPMTLRSSMKTQRKVISSVKKDYFSLNTSAGKPAGKLLIEAIF